MKTRCVLLFLFQLIHVDLTLAIRTNSVLWMEILTYVNVGWVTKETVIIVKVRFVIHGWKMKKRLDDTVLNAKWKYQGAVINIFLIITWIYLIKWGPSWAWWYGSWIYSNQCSQCLSPLKLWVRISLMAMCTHHVIKFVSDVRQIIGFLLLLRFPLPIKLTAMI